MSVLSRITEVWRRQLRFKPILWIGLATFIGYRIWPQVGAAFGVDSGSAAHPSFQLTTLDGRSISSAELRGRVVLVNFWATWCAPCRVEMPGFQAIYERKRADGFVVLGISTDADGPDRVKRFLADHGIDYPVAMAADGVAQRFGGVNVLPTSFLIDREGRIRNEVSGIFASVALEQAVNRLLAEPVTASASSLALASLSGLNDARTTSNPLYSNMMSGPVVAPRNSVPAPENLSSSGLSPYRAAG